jgi:iron complex transport system substrate-binding protein
MKLKKSIALLVTLVMLLALFGCGAADTGTGDNDASAPDTSASAPAGDTTAPASDVPAEDEPKNSEEPEYKTILNCDGSEITVPSTVDSVGCLFGPSYEKVVMLGAEDKIVFDGDYHIYSWPWSNVIYKHVNDVPGIENAHSSPNIEDLVKYEPDVVFNFPNPTTTASMTEAGMCVVPSASTGTYDSIVDQIKVYAEALGGDAPAIADRYADYYYDTVDRITAVIDTVPETDRPTVYFANQEILLANTSIAELITVCGGTPVTGDLESSSKLEISAEQLIEWNPDYIFVDHAGSSGNATAEQVVDDMLADDLYSEMTAVVNDGIVIVPTGVFFWDSGVQQPLLMLLVASTLYPEAFADFSMKDELMSFYSEFFNYDLSSEQADQILAHLDPAQ